MIHNHNWVLTIWTIYILHHKIDFCYVEDRQLLGDFHPQTHRVWSPKIP